MGWEGALEDGQMVSWTALESKAVVVVHVTEIHSSHGGQVTPRFYARILIPATILYFPESFWELSPEGRKDVLLVGGYLTRVFEARAFFLF